MNKDLIVYIFVGLYFLTQAIDIYNRYKGRQASQPKAKRARRKVAKQLSLRLSGAQRRKYKGKYEGRRGYRKIKRI